MRTPKNAINIGRKRRLREEAKKAAAHGVPEPVRKSLLEVLQENMKFADRNIYINRVIYVGEHTFPDSSSLADLYEKIVKDIDKGYCIEKLSGFLLHYSRYFCVVIEGAEDGIAKHLKLLFARDAADEEQHLHRMKLLVAYHNCNRRMVETWHELSSKPPTLLEVLNPESDVPQTYKIVKNCIQKLYRLGLDLAPKGPPPPVEKKSFDDFGAPVEIEEAKTKSQLQRISFGAGVSTTDENRFIHCLPEYAVLEFILSSGYVQDLRDYEALYGSVPDIVYFKERVWPQAGDFVPMDVFEVPKDPVTDFPPHLVPEKPS